MARVLWFLAILFAIGCAVFWYVATDKVADNRANAAANLENQETTYASMLEAEQKNLTKLEDSHAILQGEVAKLEVQHKKLSEEKGVVGTAIEEARAKTDALRQQIDSLETGKTQNVGGIQAAQNQIVKFERGIEILTELLERVPEQ